MKAEYGGVWDTIRTAVDHTKLIADRYSMLEIGRGFDADSFRAARYLVRYAAESAKPDGQRLREYTDANFPAIKQTLLSKAPIYSRVRQDNAAILVDRPATFARPGRRCGENNPGQ